MPKLGELNYYEQIGEDGRQHALNKPFSDVDRGYYLMQLGAVFALLPPVPARVLECGCGSGWLSYLLAKSGYEVVGADVSPYAVELARRHPLFAAGRAPSFVVSDMESLAVPGPFDCVVFFDSLHHAVDEQAAVDSAFRVLRAGGTLVASEPKAGHAEASRATMERFDVTEKDMPPRKIIALCRRSGFRAWSVYPRPDDVFRHIHRSSWARALASLFSACRSGIVVARK